MLNDRQLMTGSSHLSMVLKRNGPFPSTPNWRRAASFPRGFPLPTRSWDRVGQTNPRPPPSPPPSPQLPAYAPPVLHFLATSPAIGCDESRTMSFFSLANPPLYLDDQDSESASSHKHLSEDRVWRRGGGSTQPPQHVLLPHVARSCSGFENSCAANASKLGTNHRSHS